MGRLPATSRTLARSKLMGGAPPRGAPAHGRPGQLGAVAGHRPPGCRCPSGRRQVGAAPLDEVGRWSGPDGRWRRRTSASASEPAGRRGESPARHSTSSAMRLPIPATLDWSSRRALSGADEPWPAHGPARPAETVAASGPSVRDVRVERAPRRGASGRAPPASRRRRSRPRTGPSAGRAGVGRTRSWSTPVRPSTTEVAGHPEADPQGGAAVDVEQQQLADAPGRGAAAARRARRRRRRPSTPPLMNQASGVDTEATVRPSALVGQSAVHLDLGQLGHPREGSRPPTCRRPSRDSRQRARRPR